MFQPIQDIVDACVHRGMHHAIISPGSRNAPLTLAFARHPDITTYVIPDERSAAYTALGMVMKLQVPVVIICTSGTAVLNFGPAVAEAYFQRIPLVVLTADRPPELIEHQDGQTIYQEKVYGRHVKESISIGPEYHDRENIRREVSQVLDNSVSLPHGPVHINCAFREPFYPTSNQEAHNVLPMRSSSPAIKLDIEWAKLQFVWKESEKIMVLGRQSNPNVGLLEQLQALDPGIVVAGDIISNLHKLDRSITGLDTIPDSEELVPELLITFGNSGISKRLKLLLRKHPPTHHWHIQQNGQVADTYQSVTEVIRTTPEEFFSQASEWGSPNDLSFSSLWQNVQVQAQSLLRQTIDMSPTSELSRVDELFAHLPHNTQLHLANSLSVRLANYVGLKNPDMSCFANRGTSGIDGSTSTALGMAMVTDDPVVLLTGDMAFFYDRNAFWHNQLPSNVYVVVLNNHAGGIFGVIDGPSRQPELETYFETNQKLTAKNLAADFHLPYTFVSWNDRLANLDDFFQPTDRPKILELETNLQENKKAFNHLQTEIRTWN